MKPYVNSSLFHTKHVNVENIRVICKDSPETIKMSESALNICVSNNQLPFFVFSETYCSNDFPFVSFSKSAHNSRKMYKILSSDQLSIVNQIV